MAELEREVARLTALLPVSTAAAADNELLLTVLETGPSAIVFLNAAGQIRYANRQAMVVLGLSRSALVERNYNAPEWRSTDVDGGPWPDEKQPFVRVLTTGKPVHDIQHAIEWPDGRRRILSVSGGPIHDAAGAITGVVFSVHDITAAFETTRKLRESEEWLATALRGTGLGVWSWDVGSTKVRWSPELYALFEVTPATFDGSFEQYRCLIPAEDWPAIERAMNHVLQEGAPGYEVLHRVFLRSGEIRWIEGRATLLTDDSGRPHRLLGTAMDVTIRVRASQAWRESEAKLRAIADSLPFAIWMRDRARRVVFQNTASRELYGELTGTTPDQFPVPPHLLEGAHENIARALGGERVDIEVQLAGPAGPRVLRVLMAPLRVAGETIGIVGADVDITEQRRLERQLLESSKVESLGRLAAGVAHDFNNLLGAIMGLASVAAAEPDLADSVRGDLHDILAATRRGSALTRRLLAFARHHPAESRVLETASLIEQFLPFARAVLSSAIELQVDSPPGFSVFADPNQLEQVLLNLLVNARDAMPRGGVIGLVIGLRTITEEEALRHRVGRGTFVAFRVTDRGPGIPAEVRARLFEPFFTTKPVGQGTGLGLSGSLAIARQHGGFIDVESEVGRGSTFDLCLPLAEQTAVPSAPSPPDHDVPQGRGELILVAEDEPLIRGTLDRQLTDLGYRVLCASDGLAAAELAAHAGVELRAVITDLVMPRMNGLELVEKLRLERPDLRVLFITGFADGAVRPALGSHDAVLTKPVDLSTLAHALRAVLDST